MVDPLIPIKRCQRRRVTPTNISNPTCDFAAEMLLEPFAIDTCR